MADRRLVVLVTGASSGLGNACASQLAKKGYVVYGTSRDPSSRQRRADEFFELIAMDAADDDSVETAVAYVLAKEERLDRVICCAGMGIAGPVEETPILEARRQFEVNVLGVARVARAALPALRTAGGALIVVGSMAGLVGVPYQAYYSASKFALEGFVDSLRMELRGTGVQATLVEPGDFRTGFTQARAVYGLADESPYARRGRRAIAVMERSEREGSDPVIVARLMLRLVEAGRLRPRYLVGSLGQRLGMPLRYLLPRALYEWLLLVYYRQLEKE